MHIQQNIRIAPYTTLNVGGIAHTYCEVKTLEELKEVCDWSKKEDLDWYVIGNGSNIIVPDEGFSGLIIHMRHQNIHWQEQSCIVDTGVLINILILELLQKSKGGIEKLFGIPGSIGGAIYQNASAYSTEISLHLDWLQVYDFYTGTILIWDKSECGFGYRTSRLKQEKGRYIAMKACFVFPDEDPHILKNTVQYINQERQKKPQGKNVGSFFQNPEGDKTAGMLIEQANLKGFKIGGAFVSDLHANYIMNDGTATASDIFKLRDIIQMQVYEKFGIHLQEEVQIVSPHTFS